ncbi:MAG TPA: GNAT family N-acyltransferase [Pseudobdellovibrionaceae bacterium]|nr:GNAT family N-acyltransferase [Pseudobdellovibrionaceae bacterium]
MLNAIAFNSLTRVSSTIQSIYRLRQNRIHKFRPKVGVRCEIGPYLLKTVSNPKELKTALRLRHEVFYGEMIGSLDGSGFDVDEYDFLCDHLIIVHKKTEALVGTYRLNSSLFSDHFYSAREFNLSRILSQPGNKLELGRACIHKDYRNGFTIALLWKGIAEYMTATDSRILFGCASVKTQNPREAALLYRHFFEEGRLNPNYFSPPTLPYVMPGLDFWVRSYKAALTDEENARVKDLMPPLCRAYMKIGASIGGEPAWDAEFKCIDFLTILRREDINRTLWKRYKLDSGVSPESSSSSAS